MKTTFTGHIYDHMVSVFSRIQSQKYETKSIAPIPTMAVITSRKTWDKYVDHLVNIFNCDINDFFDCNDTSISYTFYGISFKLFNSHHLANNEFVILPYDHFSIVTSYCEPYGFKNYPGIFWYQCRSLNPDMSFKQIYFKKYISIYRIQNDDINTIAEKIRLTSIEIASTGADFIIIKSQPRISKARQVQDYEICVLHDDYYKYCFEIVDFYQALKMSFEYLRENQFYFIDQYGTS